MARTRENKAELLTQLEGRMNKAKAALIADYSGLNVAAVSEIRRTFPR